jgi:hypothetical protein
MSKTEAAFLDVNDKFPEMELNLVSGETLSVPFESRGEFSVILFYKHGL